MAGEVIPAIRFLGAALQCLAVRHFGRYAWTPLVTQILNIVLIAFNDW